MAFLLAEATTVAAGTVVGVTDGSAKVAGQAPTGLEAAAAVGVDEAGEAVAPAGLFATLPAELAELPTLILATAAVISAAVASSTRRFWEKMQPSTSSATSQVLPLPVSSLS